jgi:hypothetical protein
MSQDLSTMIVTVVGGLFISAFLAYKVLEMWAASEYERLLNDPKTECDIDAHVGAPAKNPVKPLKVVLAAKAQLGSRKASSQAIPLEVFPSPFIRGSSRRRRSAFCCRRKARGSC